MESLNYYMSWIGKSDIPDYKGIKKNENGDLIYKNKNGNREYKIEESIDGWPKGNLEERNGVFGIENPKTGKIVPFLGPNLNIFFNSNSGKNEPDFYLFKNIKKAWIFLMNDDKDDYEEFDSIVKKIAEAKKCQKAWRRNVEKIETQVHPRDSLNKIILNMRTVFKDKIKKMMDSQKEINTKLYILTDPGTTKTAMAWTIIHNLGITSMFNEVVLISSNVTYLREQDEPSYTETSLKNPPWLQKVESKYVELENCESPLYRKIKTQIEKASQLKIPILLIGERGTGKSSLAQHYHKHKKIKNEKKMVTITLSEQDEKKNLKYDFFGWEKGAFTGADSSHDGYLKQAHESTLFLDEIHWLPKDLQASLLRPLNDHTFRKMGPVSEDDKSDFQLIIATNDFNYADKLMDDFRDRIERIIIKVPSLREVREDIFKFWESIFKYHCKKSGVEYQVEPDIQQIFKEQFQKDYFSFKGNLRDLHRLADTVLLEITAQDNQHLEWNKEKIKEILIRVLS